VEVLMVGDGWGIAVRNECGSPQLKELIDLLL
jgi:hypothetical protein